MTQINGLNLYYSVVKNNQGDNETEDVIEIQQPIEAENIKVLTSQVNPDDMMAVMSQLAVNNKSKVRFSINPQILSDCQAQFRQLYEFEYGFVKDLAKQTPGTSEASQIRKRLDALDDKKIAMLVSLANQYPEGSKEQKALKTMGAIIKENTKLENIDLNTKNLNQSVSMLENELTRFEPGSAEALRLQTQLDSLAQIQQKLNEEQIKSENELKQLNKDLMINSRGVAPQLRSFINDVMSSEKKSDAILIKEEQLVLQEKREYISNSLEKLNASRAALLAQQQATDPDSPGAYQLQARIESFYSIENNLLLGLKTTYPLNSPQAQACKNMISLNTAEMKTGAINNELRKLDNSINALQYYLEGLIPESPEVAATEQRLEALNAIKEKLLEHKTIQEQIIKEQKAELKQNILKSPRKDQVLLADIRADHLNAENQNILNRLNNQKDKIMEYRKALSDKNNSPEMADSIKKRLRGLYNDYRQARKEYALSMREEKFWNRVEQRPV